jgi:hypothetical protein
MPTKMPSPGMVPEQDDASEYPGRIPAVVPPGTGREYDCVLAAMRRHNVPTTRENYIFMAYGSTVPTWGAELESELPEEIQDWLGTEWPWGVTTTDEEDDDEEWCGADDLK